MHVDQWETRFDLPWDGYHFAPRPGAPTLETFWLVVVVLVMLTVLLVWVQAQVLVLVLLVPIFAINNGQFRQAWLKGG